MAFSQLPSERRVRRRRLGSHAVVVTGMSGASTRCLSWLPVLQAAKQLDTMAACSCCSASPQ